MTSEEILQAVKLYLTNKCEQELGADWQVIFGSSYRGAIRSPCVWIVFESAEIEDAGLGQVEIWTAEYSVIGLVKMTTDIDTAEQTLLNALNTVTRFTDRSMGGVVLHVSRATFMPSTKLNVGGQEAWLSMAFALKVKFKTQEV